MRMEMPPDELYELYNRMGRATRLEVPVKLEDLWEALISSDYLRKLGCGLVATDQGDYLTVSQAAGARQTTRLTVSREMYDEGLADSGPKLHFATYGDEVFDSLLNHMAQYGLPLACAGSQSPLQARKV